MFIIMDGNTVLVLGADDHGRRADRIVRKALPFLSLSLIYRLFREGKVKCHNRRLSIHDHCASGDVLELEIPFEASPAVSASALESASSIPAITRSENRVKGKFAEYVGEPYIIWQNEHLRAVCKPAGMLTHDGPSSLEAWVRGLPDTDRPHSVSFTPGPLHRLDRNTSGIIMFSRSRLGAELFSRALRSRMVKKRYLALCEGSILEPLHFHDRMERDRLKHVSAIQIGGRDAEMYLVPLLSGNGFTLVEVDLKTGLTHQIRAQLAAHGFPLVGDRKYGARLQQNLRSYLLHAVSLETRPPLFEDMPSLLTAPLSEQFLVTASRLLGEDILQLKKIIAVATGSA
ncbi:MAG: RluA family pseudouridine synthase [Rectinema sp.]|nr:RluA family pseudouridine synthase [Rectinema sp.]